MINCIGFKCILQGSPSLKMKSHNEMTALISSLYFMTIVRGIIIESAKVVVAS